MGRTGKPVHAFVMVGGHLSDDELAECLIVRNGVEHLAKGGDQTEEGGGPFENGLLRHLTPLRILLKRVDIHKGCSAEFCQGLVELWMEDVHEEVVEKGCQRLHQ